MISKKIEEIKKNMAILQPIIHENFELLNKAESYQSVKTYIAHKKRRFLNSVMQQTILINELIDLINSSSHFIKSDQAPEYLSSEFRNSSDPSTREAARSAAYSLYCQKWPELL
jgi:hypothetical protein